MASSSTYSTGGQSNVPCYFFSQGNCRYGDSCRFSHSLPFAGSSQRSGGNQSKSLKSSNTSRPYVPVMNTEVVPKVNGVPGKQYNLAVTNNSNKPNLLLSAENELCVSHISMECFYDDCPYLHGTKCNYCELNVLHPYSVEQREHHQKECEESMLLDVEYSFKVHNSNSKPCGICMETLTEKHSKYEAKFGILENCNHVFCITCIKHWRTQKENFDKDVYLACPECRVQSFLVVPCALWVEDETEKKKVFEDYKKSCKKKDCKNFNRGEGYCWLDDKCLFKHQMPDGTIIDVQPESMRPRRRFRDDGEAIYIRGRGTDFNLADVLEEEELYGPGSEFFEMFIQGLVAGRYNDSNSDISDFEHLDYVFDDDSDLDEDMLAARIASRESYLRNIIYGRTPNVPPTPQPQPTPDVIYIDGQQHETASEFPTLGSDRTSASGSTSTAAAPAVTPISPEETTFGPPIAAAPSNTSNSSNHTSRPRRRRRGRGTTINWFGPPPRYDTHIESTTTGESETRENDETSENRTSDS